MAGETQARPGIGVAIMIVEEDNSRVPLGEVSGVTWPGFSTEILDATHTRSPGGRREKIGGVIDPGQVTATLRVVPGSAGLKRLYEDAGKTLDFVVEFPAPIGQDCTFQAILESWAPSEAGISSLIEGTITLAVTGPITWAEAAPAP